MATPANVESVYPLSPLQQGMLFHTLLAPEAGAYHDHIGCRIRARPALDLARLRRAMEQVLLRHSVLRTAFAWKHQGRPHQVVLRRLRPPLALLDWRALPADRHDDLLGALLAADRARPFDLARPPLFRLLLVRLHEDLFHLVLSYHHAIMDAWSVAVVLRDLVELYDSASRGRAAALPAVPPFRTYIDWLAQQDPARSEGFWRRSLHGLSAATPLGYDRPPAEVSGHARRDGECSARLPPATVAALQAFAGARQITFSTLVQAAWLLLLSRTGGEPDVVFGVVVSGRPHDLPSIEAMVGLFTNTVPVRGEVRGEEPLWEWLARCQRHQLDLLEFQWSPLQAVQEWSAVPRGEPLFESVVVFQNTPAMAGEGDGQGDLAVRVVHHEPRNNFPLTLMVAAHSGLALRLLFDASRFDRVTLIRRLDQLARTLLALPQTTAATRVGDLPEMSPVERHQLLREWNDAAAVLPAGPDFAAIFAAQARRSPAAVAVGAVTYAELAERAAAAARRLRALGVGGDTVVALLAERGVDFLAAMLGVFAAAGGYLPLDAGHPAERQAQILGRGRPRLVLCAAALLPALAAAGEPAARVVTLEDLFAPAGRAADEAAAPPSSPDRLAYVIYTSGSTGVPKGAMVTQAGMVNHLWAKRRDLALTAADVVAQTASPCFDISVWQFLAPLAVGARVEVVDDATARDPRLLLDAVDGRGVTIFETVPSMLRALAADAARRGGARPPLAALRWLIPTGEALPPDLCREWLRLYPHVALLNAYGPTECSDDVTHQPIRLPPPPASSSAAAASEPIGRPVVNTRLYVLEGGGAGAALALPGVAGELYVGGAGVGRGYFDDPARTAAVFLPDRFAGEPGARLYRTGDRARHLPAGELTFLGRADHQVKVRGFRIELGEIEAALRGSPRVGDAVVVVRDAGDGEAALVAYVVARAAAPPDRAAAAGGEPIESWRLVFDEVYRRGDVSARDAGVNLRVWIDSYSGLPFSEEEIFESVESSAARILALSPRRLLELGCGTGLMLLRVAPHCAAYWGTDLSAEALAGLDHQLAGRPELAARVRLLQRPAHLLADLGEAEPFDVVVLNELVQYFPDVEYLATVLAGAADRVGPGGRVFVGGVRSRPLQSAFYLAALLGRVADTATLDELRGELAALADREKELLVAPDFFRLLAQSHPRIGGVRFELKGGRRRNEFTQFRYDVVLEIEPPPGRPAAAMVPWEDWTGDAAGRRTLADLRQRLAVDPPPLLAVAGLPNRRVQREVRALGALAADAGLRTAGDLRRWLEETAAESAGFDPAELWALGDELGYRVEVSWAAGGELDRCDAVFTRAGVDDLAPLPRPAVLPIAAGDAADGARYAAYANVPRTGSPAAADLEPELRAELRRRLPDYMVPSAFVTLAALPLTANGKIDRQALPAPGPRAAAGAAAGRPPRTQTEELLLEVWAQVLGRGGIGVEEPFFEAGGHSLLAIQVISRIRTLFAVELPLRAMFEAPTVAGLARKVEQARQEGDAGPAPLPPLPPITRVPRDGRHPLSLAQQRLWIVDRLDPGSATYNLPIALRIRGALDPAVLAATLSEVVRRHEALRTTFRADAAGPCQVIGAAGRLRLPCCDLGALAAAAAAESLRLALAESQRPFDLEAGPLLRASLLRLSADHHVLLLTLHHIVSDFWSMGILVREVAALYEAFSRRRPSPLPELAVQYVDFAVWQQGWMQGAVLAARLAFWKRNLQGRARRPFALPGSRPEPPAPTSRGATLTFALPPATSRALVELGRRCQTTLFMTLLAAFKTLLYRLTRDSDVVVGTDVANRNSQETEEMMGFFVNLLALRTEVSGNLTFRELLERVRGVALEAFAHRDLPFDRVIAELRLPREPAGTPLVDYLFVFENAPLRPLRLSGLTLSPLGADHPVSRFNLALFMEESAQGLIGRWNHRLDVLAPPVVARLSRQFEGLLASIVAHPEGYLDDLELPGGEPAERRPLGERLPEAGPHRLKTIRPRAVALSPEGAERG